MSLKRRFAQQNEVGRFSAYEVTEPDRGKVLILSTPAGDGAQQTVTRCIAARCVSSNATKRPHHLSHLQSVRELLYLE